MVNKWLKIIHECCYPSVCLICRSAVRGNRDLCKNCAATLPYNRLACRSCGEQLPATTNSDVCGQCTANKPDFDATFALFLYQEPVRYLIRSLKFQNDQASARLLGGLMAERIRSREELPEAIIPVPLHRNRYIERGFNQSIELARPVAKACAIPLLPSTCVRHRHTKPQPGLSAQHRRRNLRNAFAVTGPVGLKHVAILDDVITTGCTVNELAKLLRNNNVSKIEVWAIAKASKTG